MQLEKLTYRPFLDKAFKYFLKNKKGDARLDEMLDLIDNYESIQRDDYYGTDDDDFEIYRLRRKLTRGLESGVSDSSMEDILKRAKEKSNDS